jgi:hypothetical protein
VPEFRSDVPPVRLRNGSNAPGRVVMTVQTAPDRLWAVAEQARAAAMDAGFVVQGVRATSTRAMALACRLVDAPRPWPYSTA